MSIRLSSVPEFFRKYANDAEYKQLIQAFTSAYQRAIAQKSLETFNVKNIIDINNLTNVVYNDFQELVIYDITGKGLTSDEREYLLTIANVFEYIDSESTGKLFSNTLYTAEHLSDSLVNPDLSLTSGVDFYVNATIDFNVEFITPPFQLNFYTNIFTNTNYPSLLDNQNSRLPYDTVAVFLPSSGRTMTLSRAVIYAEGASTYQDWYYKRLGILANLEEGTPPGVVLAVYKAMKSGLTVSTLTAALNALAGYPISLSDADKITKVDATYIETEKRTYNIPQYADLGRLRSVIQPGYVLSMCEAIFDVVSVERSKTWYDDIEHATASYLDVIPPELFTYVNRNVPTPHLMVPNSPFWVGFPGIPYPMVPSLTPTRDDLIELNTHGDNDAFEQLVNGAVALPKYDPIAPHDPEPPIPNTSYSSILINPNRTLIQKILCNHMLIVKLLSNSFNVEDLFDTTLTWRDKVWQRINATIPVWTYLVFDTYFEEDTAEEILPVTGIDLESAFDVVNTNVSATIYGLQFDHMIVHTLPALITLPSSSGVDVLINLYSLPANSADIYFDGVGPLDDAILRLTPTSLKLYYGAVLIHTFAYVGELLITFTASGNSVTVNGESVDITGLMPEINSSNFVLNELLLYSLLDNIYVNSIGFGVLP